ncbi:transposable element Tcb1 transposase [Trichonephila clavipes]|nr:transposable element Tcb1 transposase [Trichonephila clavipes]
MATGSSLTQNYSRSQSEIQENNYLFICLSNSRVWLLEHVPLSLQVSSDDVVRWVFIQSSALEQVVAIHSGMAAEWAGQASGDILPKSQVRWFWRKRAIASALSKCLRIGPTVAKVSHDSFQGSWSFGPRYQDLAIRVGGVFSQGQGALKQPTEPSNTGSVCFWQTARGGRVRSTTPAEDRYIVLSTKRNRRTTAQQVANQFLAASGKQISRKTVARRLRGGGLYARRPVVCVPLTRQHRTARLQWCREHHNWTEQDWACVLFSDESRFGLSSDCRRQLIWRESGTAYRPENIQKKDRYPTCSIMVCASIMINGRTRLHVVANGTMTSQRYIDEVLLPHVRLFRGAVGDKFVFMDDNATCHRTLAVQDCLDSEGIQRLVWPARSPDLNSIENVWDAFGRQVAGRNYPPTNKNTLIRALTEEWDKLPQQLLDNVVQSMVRRVECCITLHGGHIPY